MWALDHPRRPPSAFFLAGTPLALIAALGAGLLVVIGLAELGWLPSIAIRVAAMTAGHGALLGTALAWAREPETGAVDSSWLGFSAVGLVAVGTTAAAVHPLGTLGFLLTPLWLVSHSVRGRLVGLGLGTPVSTTHVLLGAGIGLALGGHLLVSAEQTLGYPMRGGGWAPLLALVAYDIGANVPSAECFFRGALFNRAQRRWSFRPGLAMATVACLLRYLIDPLLPKSVEVVLGALFYLALLSAANCWLLWRSGSLVPGLVSSLIFFLAYRLLAIG